MSADSVSVLTVGLAPDLESAVAEAARSAWERVGFAECADVSAADRMPVRAREIMVLGEAVPAGDRARAASAIGPDGLPRWPVLALIDDDAIDGIWPVPADLRRVSSLSYLLRMALRKHTITREARRAVGDLHTIARRISHELRSPIGCILTSADLIREEMEDVAPAVGELAQPVIDSARDVMVVVDRLTLIARASAHAPPVESLDAGMVAWAAQERVRHEIEEACATVSEPGDWPKIVGRREWLEQIWVNLLSNAVRHGGPRAAIDIGWKHEQDGIRFFVRDRGPGVAEEVIPVMFRHFHQLHQHDSIRGLGLAIVQRLVSLLGGRVGHEPVEPHGACFYFVLPASADDRDSAGKEPRSPT